MEVLGATASILGIIQVAGTVTQLCHGFIGKARKARKDIRELMEELNSLSEVFSSLKDYTDKDSQSTEVLQILGAQGGPLSGCLSELKGLETRLISKKPKRFRKMITRSLKWPFEETEILQIISRIERQKNLFTIALSTDHIILSKAIERDVRDIGVSVEEFQREFRAESAAQDSQRRNDDARRKSEKRKKVLTWLYPESCDEKHNEISSNRQKDTGKWLLSSPEFQKWAEGLGQQNSLLWGHGIPGAGKTYISSVVIDHFQDQAKRENHGVAHIYFNFNEQNQQTPVHVLASLTKQLAYQIPQLPAEIEQLHDELEPRDEAPTLERLYAALAVTFKSFDRIFLTFDALDEYNLGQRGQLLPLMHKMGKDGASLFLTSHDYLEDIQDSLRDVTRIKISATADDIRHYIQERIRKNPRTKRLVRQGNCEDRIVAELTDCAEGMFLLVRLHIDHICQQPTVGQIIIALEKLKNTPAAALLDLTYDRVMTTIRQQSESCTALALRIFAWIMNAKRVLQFKEIQIAVSVERGRCELDQFDIPDIKTILEVCASLVVIDEANNIRFAHLTVQEYLVRKAIIPKEAETQVAIACTTYLSFDAFAQHPVLFPDTQLAKDAREGSHPFLSYACHYLYPHLRSCDKDISVEIGFKFLKSSGSISHYCRHTKYRCELNPLHLASTIGNCLAIQFYLDKGADVEAADGKGWTALFAAASEGHEAVVRLLLENGADIEPADGKGWTALLAAASGGHEAVVRLLLEKGADIEAADEDGWTALFAAASEGHGEGWIALFAGTSEGYEAVVQLLLENGADIEAADEKGWTALSAAASRGHEAVVRLLLEKGADIEAADEDGWTALLKAASKGHEAVVRLLLEKGADIEAAYYGETALSAAASRGHEAVVRLLLEKGADIEAAYYYGETALLKAASEGHEAVVRLLLEKGADIEAEAVVRILLKKGPDIEAVYDGETALLKAASEGHEAVVRLLLENDADIEAVYCGETALLKAASRGHEAVVRLLLENGADIEAVDKGGETALLAVVFGGNEVVVRLLLEKGADIEAVDEGGWTALLWGASRGHEAVVRLLLEKGADIEDEDEDGWTALLAAAFRGREAVVQLLLEKGADIEAADKYGRTALFLAASEGHEAVVQLLLEKGANISAASSNEISAAASRGHHQVAQLLRAALDEQLKSSANQIAR